MHSYYPFLALKYWGEDDMSIVSLKNHDKQNNYWPWYLWSAEVQIV